MDRRRQLTELADLIEVRCPGDGRWETEIDGVEVFRASSPSPIRCQIYDPCVIIVAQGRKAGTVGRETYDYSPARYLVLPVSLPIEAQVVEASPERPFLSFALRVDPGVLGGIVDLLDSGEPAGKEAPRGIAVSETSDELLDASVRLLSCLDSDDECRLLAPLIKREIFYRVLKGPQGDLLRGVGSRNAKLNHISRSLGLIHREFSRPIEVAEMARAAHMSLSTFYDAFRAVTAQTPLQYLKEIRLNRARQAMVWEGVSAKKAAAQVGYSSPSQFSREFKRRFGRTPTEEVEWATTSGELLAS